MGLNAHASAFAPPTASDGLTPVIGPTREALKAALKERGVAGFRADQIWKWVYQRGVTDFAEMSNLAKDLRAQMAAEFSASQLSDLQSRVPRKKLMAHAMLLAGQALFTVPILLGEPCRELNDATQDLLSTIRTQNVCHLCSFRFRSLEWPFRILRSDKARHNQSEIHSVILAKRLI